MSTLKNDLNEELSTIMRKYEQRGMSSADIADSFDWHAELAESRSKKEHAVHADS